MFGIRCRFQRNMDGAKIEFPSVEKTNVEVEEGEEKEKEKEKKMLRLFGLD